MTEENDVSLKEWVARYIADHDAWHARAEQAHEKQHHAEQLAVGKAEAAMTQRLAAMNEFRDQLRDQAQRYATRDALDTRVAAIEREFRLYGEGLRTRVEVLEKNEQRDAGKGAGLQAGWGYLVAAIGVLVLIINLVVYLVSR